MGVSVIVPTYNEQGNIDELVARVSGVVDASSAELLFVDDSTDDTVAAIQRAAATTPLAVRVIHRDRPSGGLAGAVRDGLRASTQDWVVVMDGDLQHPPELIPVLLDTARSAGADIAVASRYVAGGSSSGLSSAARGLVSRTSTLLARAMFPIRLRDCSDPMTGFFAFRRDAVDVDALRPRGFKILLEILARHRLAVVEEPFVFNERASGESKASLGEGIRYLQQLAALRFGRLSGFAIVGAPATGERVNR